MKIKPNIGIINALIRITIGFTVISWSTAKLVKKPWRDSYLLMAMLGAMKIAEGIVRFCPVTALFERGQDMMGGNDGFMKHDDHNHEPFVPANHSDKKEDKGGSVENQALFEQIKNSVAGGDLDGAKLDKILPTNPS
ncbi:MAG: DUF2892 domain-containing protein [Bacillota bacterium]|nr:DUF2892 domain-containing protein [Bacillota bacterium]MDP4171152.1 DUF2892 domain-containing protein [Bacillota bacterium]